MNGAQVIASTLQDLGVARVFGIPGVQNLELFDALAEVSLEPILVTHELSAGFMADAAGRLTGRPGVLVTVPGPGATNVATGLGEALLDSSPVLAIITAVRNDLPYKYQLHEINQAAFLSPLAKKVYSIQKPDELSAAIREAYALTMTGEPGPVVVQVPTNVLFERAARRKAPRVEAKEPPRHARKIEQVIDLIGSATRPGIYAGAGAMNASATLIELAERICAPVATTISGRGVIPEDHFLSVGFGYGGSGTFLAESVFKECDLLIAVGCKFSEVATGSYGFTVPKKSVHIDANPGAIGANFEPTVGIAGDAEAVLSDVLAGIGEGQRPDTCRLIDSMTADKSAYFAKIQDALDSPDHVNPRKLLTRLRVHLDRNAILTVDSGNHAFYVLSDFQALLPRTVLAPTDYNSMGFAVPAAVAAAMTCPDRQVVATVGDGGLLMSGNELVTALRHGLAPVVVVFNDGALGLIKLLQQHMYGRTAAVDLPKTDLRAYARFLGVKYVLIENDLEIDVGIKRALGSKRPVIVDARVRYDAATRYFTGVARANAGRLPFSQLVRIGARLLRRSIRKTI